jgi:N-acetylglucosamine-6-phosphate deacetylase
MTTTDNSTYRFPGLFDSHIHGFKGANVMDGTFEAINTIAQGLPEVGVTSFFPTTLTGTVEQLEQVCKVIAENINDFAGARIQGICFEGPFFTNEFKGAQNPSYFLDPDLKLFERWQTAANGLIKKIALAPERPGSVEFIKEMVKQGVTVSIGHSAATYAEAMAAIEAGATVINHTFNGMSGFKHQAPGMLGAALNSPDNVFCELICDGVHVQPPAVEVLLKAKGKKNIVLITDAMQAAGQPDGDYLLGEFPVTVANGAVRLKSNGALAASVLVLDVAVRNLIDWNFATPAESFAMGSAIPAESVSLSLPDDDFVVVNSSYRLLETYISGQLVYSATR